MQHLKLKEEFFKAMKKGWKSRKFLVGETWTEDMKSCCAIGAVSIATKGDLGRFRKISHLFNPIIKINNEASGKEDALNKIKEYLAI
jgi:hypothetical protein